MTQCIMTFIDDALTYLRLKHDATPQLFFGECTLAGLRECVPATQILFYLLTCTHTTYGWQILGYYRHPASVGDCCSPNDSVVQTYN